MNTSRNLMRAQRREGRGISLSRQEYRREIDDLITENPWRAQRGEEAFIFYNDVSDHRPAHGDYMTRCLYWAIEEAGIPEEERKKRNITFHSWRYFLNSLLINAKIPLQKVQSVTGHLTAEMSQHYYAMNVDEMSDILQIQESILDESGEGRGTVN